MGKGGKKGKKAAAAAGKGKKLSAVEAVEAAQAVIDALPVNPPAWADRHFTAYFRALGEQAVANGAKEKGWAWLHPGKSKLTTPVIDWLRTAAQRLCPAHVSEDPLDAAAWTRTGPPANWQQVGACAL
jgi:hypothetical protein